MKKKVYKIHSLGMWLLDVEGGIMQRCENTGQITIYESNSPDNKDIVAIIPKDLMVIVETP